MDLDPFSYYFIITKTLNQGNEIQNKKSLTKMDPKKNQSLYVIRISFLFTTFLIIKTLNLSNENFYLV